MNNSKYIYLLVLFSCIPFASNASVDDHIEAKNTQIPSFKINSNVFLEIEDFNGYQIKGKRVFDKVSPVVQFGINPTDSKWSYFMEYKVSMRNYTTNYHSENTSYNRNRLQLQADRMIMQNHKSHLNLSFVYRKESNDVRMGQPAKNSYHSYWLIPAGSYHFTKRFSFVFWDAIYYYDNVFSGPDYNDFEWESEHGAQYTFNDNFLGKLMFYTDRTWNSSGNKTWEQNQIRGYFPMRLNRQWNIQPYFRFFLNEKNYASTTGKITNSADFGGFRVGLILNYNLTPKTTLWTNLAWEQTTWEYSKNSEHVKFTYGNDNTQDFRLYSIGIKHIW